MINVKEQLNLQFKGHLNIKTMDDNIVLNQNNLVVNNAKTIVTSCLAGSPSADFISYIGFGTGTVAPVIVDAQLGNQIHQIDAWRIIDRKCNRKFFSIRVPRGRHI